MSISSLINSPRAKYEIKNLKTLTDVFKAQVLAVNNGVASVVTNIVSDAAGTTPLTLTIPAGTYDFQMVGTIGTALVDTTIHYAQLFIVDTTSGVAIGSSSSKSFVTSTSLTNVGPAAVGTDVTSTAKMFFNFNETVRIVLTSSSTTVRLDLVYAGLNNACFIYTGNSDQYASELTARLTVIPTL
jgi:hypothetical protein